MINLMYSNNPYTIDLLSKPILSLYLCYRWCLWRMNSHMSGTRFSMLKQLIEICTPQLEMCSKFYKG